MEQDAATGAGEDGLQCQQVSARAAPLAAPLFHPYLTISASLSPDIHVKKFVAWKRIYTNSDSLRCPLIEKTVNHRHAKLFFLFFFSKGGGVKNFLEENTRGQKTVSAAASFTSDEVIEGRFSETPFAVPELQSFPARFVWMLQSRAVAGFIFLGCLR